MRSIFRLILLGLLLGSLILGSVVAQNPTGPNTITIGAPERLPDTGTKSDTNAFAGNVTMINLTTDTVTRTYQGYYGTVSGQIVLSDSQNNTMYNWSVTSPEGEVYTVRSVASPTVDWGSVLCATQAQIQAEDTALNVNLSIDEDALNRTFLTSTAHPQFYVGSAVNIAADSCAAVDLNANSAPSSNWKEVLLHDQSLVVYTSILNDDQTGFDGGTYDFQMMVGEDGHGLDNSPSTYWFFVEIE